MELTIYALEWKEGLPDGTSEMDRTQRIEGDAWSIYRASCWIGVYWKQTTISRKDGKAFDNDTFMFDACTPEEQAHLEAHGIGRDGKPK